MNIQKRLIKFITWTNWILLFIVSICAFAFAPAGFTRGLVLGGLLVTINFHLLGRTLKKALMPPHISSHNIVLAKYYLRFFTSGIIIFVLIIKQLVDPLGLIIGLSVVVVSIMLATLIEVKKLIFREAV